MDMPFVADVADVTGRLLTALACQMMERGECGEREWPVRVAGTDYRLPDYRLPDYRLPDHRGRATQASPVALRRQQRPGAPQCGAGATAISVIQGRSDTSPMVGKALEVEAVVSAVFPGLNGFFLLEDEADQDDDPLTSEGLFVYLREAAVAPGQRVRVRGKVTEYHGQTQISAAAIHQCAAALEAETLAALPLRLPLENLEALEGMLVQVPEGLTVLDVSEWGRYGSVLLGTGRHMAPTQLAPPGKAADALHADTARQQIVLDDGSTAVNPSSIAYLAGGLSPGAAVRAGDRVAGFTAVLGFGFDAWRLHPVEPVRFQAHNLRPEPPPRHADANLRVAAFNVMNFFNGDGRGGGFPTARGARSAAELERQKAQLVAALQQLDADIVALAEVENDGYGEHSALTELAAALGAQWRFVNPGIAHLGGDEIAVGLLYRSNVVEPVGKTAWLAEGTFKRLNRVPLAQGFRLREQGGVIVVVANHFKSKGCRGATGADADHGQGCWNPVREAAAAELVRWLAQDPTGLGESATLIAGDLNSYARESPVQRLQQAGYRDLLARFQGEQAYTYVYAGRAGYLDYLLATEALAAQVLTAATWPINADEPRALGYGYISQAASQVWLPAGSAVFRSSDHDPVYADFYLRDVP